MQNWTGPQGRSYVFVIGTAIGEGSGGRLGPLAGPGQRPGWGPRGRSPRKLLHFSHFQQHGMPLNFAIFS